MTSSVISPGHHLYAGPDGTWRYAAPGDRFVRVGGPDGLLRDAQQILHGVRDSAGADDQLRRVLDGFRDRGLVAPRNRTLPRTVRTIHVDGDNVVAALVAELLRPHGDVTTGLVDEGVVTHSDVLISCAGWLPDARWVAVDGWCRASGTAWHRLHFEGVSSVLGPMYVPGETASYVEVRGRRLAASGVAAELVAHWVYLDGTDPQPPVPWPDAAGASILAGLMARDVLSYLAGDPVPSTDRQLVVDLATAEISHHPVLPLPAVAV
ncbi:hypothetical protein [Tenggerimyces flavus]|uniref:Uncharacterized protein n=1 Tax=Tenggerimyces flavus TaxID=1708749 RepID=A0ABV7Y3Y8_9ACTN|nr:hypothetical protein [Tenggerimyces flavus]MBM7790625.1 bacteriocin biosynthesis cyclodehydratase domain-containing protein [Tenggerimyces flavus]